MPESAKTDELLSSPYVYEYVYRRSTGPVIGQFLGGLRDGQLVGVRTKAGKVVCPPTEYDPETGEAVGDFVNVGPGGVVTTWSWMPEPRAGQPLDRPFAWALVKLDGADTAMLHAVDAGSIEKMKTGMRVVARWKDAREGTLADLVCFVPEAS